MNACRGRESKWIYQQLGHHEKIPSESCLKKQLTLLQSSLCAQRHWTRTLLLALFCVLSLLSWVTVINGDFDHAFRVLVIYATLKILKVLWMSIFWFVDLKVFRQKNIFWSHSRWWKFRSIAVGNRLSLTFYSVLLFWRPRDFVYVQQLRNDELHKFHSRHDSSVSSCSLRASELFDVQNNYFSPTSIGVVGMQFLN